MSRSRSLEDLRAYRALALIGAVLLTGLSFAGILVVFQMGSSPGTWLVVGDLATLGLILVPVGAALLWRRFVRFQRAIAQWPVRTGDPEIDSDETSPSG
jgi:hypothetical protein